MLRSLVGSEMCIRDSINAEYGGSGLVAMDAIRHDQIQSVLRFAAAHFRALAASDTLRSARHGSVTWNQPGLAVQRLFGNMADITSELAGGDPDHAVLANQFDTLGELSYDLMDQVQQIRRPPEMAREIEALELQLRQAAGRLDSQATTVKVLQETLSEALTVHMQLCESAAELEARHWVTTDSLSAAVQKCDRLEKLQPPPRNSPTELQAMASELYALRSMLSSAEPAVPTELQLEHVSPLKQSAGNQSNRHDSHQLLADSIPGSQDPGQLGEPNALESEMFVQSSPDNVLDDGG
eukprot:TRINITY_DN55623_c0_g1_i1.p1 TRINITY_DN55623_c0_g1~~TRINITY_DN55623_c0_g1_i1.p1  ORF type:complete len:326 (-),score=77.92 TRINITY_DN55623_c0_g1_i1:47-934(-)